MKSNPSSIKTVIEGAATTKSVGRTTVLHFDHMNDYRGYTNTLKKWTKQLQLGGVLFLSLHCKPRPRHIFAILDSPTVPGNTGEFLTRLRSQNVDVNMRGKPCKERMSKVIGEFPLLLSSSSSSAEMNNNEFQIIETEGSGRSKSHMPFVREWLELNRSNDAKSIIAAMDKHLDSVSTTSSSSSSKKRKGR